MRKLNGPWALRLGPETLFMLDGIVMRLSSDFCPLTSVFYKTQTFGTIWKYLTLTCTIWAQSYLFTLTSRDRRVVGRV
jgi:hypothetical protein